MSIYIYKHIYKYEYMYACMYEHMYACIYEHMYIPASFSVWTPSKQFPIISDTVPFASECLLVQPSNVPLLKKVLIGASYEMSIGGMSSGISVVESGTTTWLACGGGGIDGITGGIVVLSRDGFLKF